MPEGTEPTTKSIWCCHCGKEFSRKEHLERHIPTHTNLKPWPCPLCYLRFTRKDLLARHVSTYHVAKAPGDSSASGPQAVSGRPPIACANCASAKTACNKEVPCERCRQKNIHCSPRFARRSSKMASRTSRAMDDCQDQTAQGGQPGDSQPAFSQPQLQSGPVLRGADHQPAQSPHHLHSPIEFGHFSQNLDNALQSNVPVALRRHSSPGTCGDAMDFPLDTADNDLFLPLGDFGPNYQDISQEYPSLYPAFGADREEEMYRYMGLDSQNNGHVNPYGETSEGSPSMGFLSTASPSSTHTRGTSMSSDLDMQQAHQPLHSHMPVELRFDATASRSTILEFEDVVKAEASWPLARCTKPLYSGKCPRTALTHLTFFQRSSKGHGTWKPLENYVREHVNWEDEDLTAVVPLSDYTRDSMLAITQKFLYKALEIHGSSGGRDGFSAFVILPPSEIIQYFLRSYVRSLSVYYPLVVGCVDPNDMLADCRPSTLLLLLMIAQGAAAMPVAEARYLSTGLIETCRISLFDIIEKNVELSADPVALRCALLFTLLGSWSGDKWLMDIAMGQRGMYMSMLKHAGMLEPQPIPNLDLSSDNTKAQYGAWIRRESRNRLVYNWVMLDHELSLFHDTAPLLAITELQSPLPAAENLWATVDTASWTAAMQAMSQLAPHPNPEMTGNHLQAPSLFELFQNFLQINLTGGHAALPPQQLRLLLHPIQAMVCQLRLLQSCLPDTLGNSHAGLATVSKDSMEQRTHEIHNLLHRWYSLAKASSAKGQQCPLACCNLALYHLMYLNTVTNFLEIERLARREGLNEKSAFPPLELSLRHRRCILQREEAILHCGQVLGLLRQMPRNRRPSWWTAAMYRAVLTLWANSISRMDCSLESEQLAEMGNNAISRGQLGSYQPVLIPIDGTREDDPALTACIRQRNGIPVLSYLDGRAIGLDNPVEILEYGIKTVDEADSSRIGDGIRRKLATLMNNWNQVKPWEIVEEPSGNDISSWGSMNTSSSIV